MPLRIHSHPYGTIVLHDKRYVGRVYPSQRHTASRAHTHYRAPPDRLMRYAQLISAACSSKIIRYSGILCLKRYLARLRHLRLGRNVPVSCFRRRRNGFVRQDRGRNGAVGVGSFGSPRTARANRSRNGVGVLTFRIGEDHQGQLVLGEFVKAPL